MPRLGGLLVLFVSLSAGCTSTGDEGARETGPASSLDATAETDPTRSGAAPGVTIAADGRPSTTTSTSSDRVATRPDGPDLPGLVDESDAPIPDDESVRTGVLDNGLTYFVRSNDNPGSKVTLRLAVAAGSVDEPSDAAGLAHFAEHMLFNGTAAFPENRLIDVLRGFGADFGPDINAYTSFDETVYKLVVPNDDESVALALEVLGEWLSNATIDPSAVAAERGVVLDEWRVRTQSRAGRLFAVAQELFLAGTAYDGKAPIGTAESIAAMSAVDLRAFYDTWYRPDRAAIIVVGDVDADDLVSEVMEAFGSIEARAADVSPGDDRTFDTETEPDFGLHVDSEQPTVDVEVSLPIPGDTGTGTRAARTTLIDAMIDDALIRRLDEDRAAGLAPFDEVARGGNSIVPTLDAPALFASTDAARVTETLTALLDEYARAFEHGFGTNETDLARESLQSLLDTRFDGRASRQDGDIADALVESFLTGAPYPTIADEYRVLTAELEAVTPEALDLRFRARWANTAPHVIISAPANVAGRMPDRPDVLEIVRDTYRRPVASREASRDLPDSLMERPDPVDEIGRELLIDDGVPIFDPELVTYRNGVDVVSMPNEIVEGRVYMRAVSPGGSSRVADADVIDARYAAEVVAGGGLADFNAAEVARINADADVEIAASIEPYQDVFSGVAATADLETLFQMLHLSFTEPRFDQIALDRVRSREQPVVDDPGSDPAAATVDALVDARYSDALRHTVIPSPAEFATLDLDGVERVWTDRHADAGDWTFVFAGDVDPETLWTLAASYLGTLPATGDEEGFADLGIPLPDAPIRETIEAGTGETATVTMLFTTPAGESIVEERVEADVASQVLSARLTRVVREELGDSYSPDVVSYLTADPSANIETVVRVSGAPDRVGAIAEVVLDEFSDLAGGGMTESEFEQAFALIEEQYNFVNNSQFLEGVAPGRVFPELGVDSFLDRVAELRTVDDHDITEFIGDRLPLDAFVQITTVPRS